MRTDNWYNENKEIILKNYYNGKRIEDICTEMICNKSKLYRKFKEWDIQKRKRISTNLRHNAKYEIDYNYFKIIDNEHKAYWLGFLLADGFVNQKEISFCLQKQDEKMIELFRKDLKSNHPIKYNKDNNPYITIVCKSICEDLINKGLHNRKSWSIEFDKVISFVPKNFLNHFIRGMFDGDGCIKYYNYDYLSKPQFHFGYTGVKNVCDYLKNLFNIKRELFRESDITFTLVTRDPNKINEIFDYLYKDSTIYMNRKYETFNAIKMMTFNDYNKAIS